MFRSRKPQESRNPQDPSTAEQQLRDLVRTSMDFEFYVGNDPELSHLDPMTAADHYIDVGAPEGRDPTRWFGTSYYVDRYPEVAESGQNPFLHYLIYGHAEHRYPCFQAEHQSTLVNRTLVTENAVDEPRREVASRWQKIVELSSGARCETDSVRVATLVIFDSWDRAAGADEASLVSALLEHAGEGSTELAALDLSPLPDGHPFQNLGASILHSTSGDGREGSLRPPEVLLVVGETVADLARRVMANWRQDTTFAVAPRQVGKMASSGTSDRLASNESDRRQRSMMRLLEHFDLLVLPLHADRKSFEERLLLSPSDAALSRYLDPIHATFQILGPLRQA